MKGQISMLPRVRWAAVWAIGFSWLVTTLVVGWGLAELRVQVREQIVGRDARILHAMARTPMAGDGDETLAPDAFATFVSMARLEGTIAARLFDPDGTMQASMPVAVRDTVVPSTILAAVRGGEPVARYVPEQALADVFLDPGLLTLPEGADTIPVVESYVPLVGADGKTIEAVAGFVVEGRAVAEEFARLDRRLLLQASAVLGTALLVTGAVLVWVFRRLARAGGLLARRTEELQRANRELSQSARVAALGAVTAHLVHGLRNPLSGLHSFVVAQAGTGPGDETSWGEARAATQRMQALLQAVVSVIREQETDVAYDVSPRELAGLVDQRARGMAERQGVRLQIEGDPPGNLDNRTSGLLALALSNLVENAIDATPAGGQVALRLSAGVGWLSCEVEDEGGGVPMAVQERLFQPYRSNKEGGSGLGLAITRQLVLALGGRVTLVRTGLRGSLFRVELPFGRTIEGSVVPLATDPDSPSRNAHA